MKSKESDSYSIGYEFEELVLNSMFPKKEYNVVRMTHSPEKLKKRFVEDSSNPDFTFRRKSDGYTFGVECKFRSNWKKGGEIQWTKKRKLDAYRKYSNDSGYDVFIVIGIGGKPSNPEEIFLMPLSKIHNTLIYKTEKRLHGVVFHQCTNNCIDELKEKI